MKALQTFTKEYLDHCRQLSHMQIAQFLDDFRNLQLSEKPDKSKLISIKIPLRLLSTFRLKAQATGVPYQTLIKQLMKVWVESFDMSKT